MDIEKEERKSKENSGLYFKDLGNAAFEKENYEEAILNYTKAIVKFDIFSNEIRKT